MIDDNIDNLLLEQQKAIRADSLSIKTDLKENIARPSRLEISVAGLRRDLAHSDEGLAEQSVRIDRLNDRIERRLELA